MFQCLHFFKIIKWLSVNTQLQMLDILYFKVLWAPKNDLFIEYYNIHEWKTKPIFQLTEVYKSPQFTSLMIHHGLATFLHRLYDINPPII